MAVLQEADAKVKSSSQHMAAAHNLCVSFLLRGQLSLVLELASGVCAISKLS